MIDYTKILQSRYAIDEWWIAGNDYHSLEWFSSSPKPTKATLDGLWASVQTEIAHAQIAKESARQAVLDKLGLSTDEAQALFG